MARSRPQFRLFDLVMWVILAGIILAFVRQLMQIPNRRDGDSDAPVIFVAVLFGIWVAVWRQVRAKRTGPVCQECGRRFLAEGILANSTLCARCRPASLPPEQSRREQTTSWLAVVFFMTILMGMIGLPFWNSLTARLGGFAWLVYPLLAFGATLGLLCALVLALAVIALVRNWRMRYEKPALAWARKCSRQEGTVERSGPLTIWSSGPDNPVPMALEQTGIARSRFEHLVDEPVPAPPLRVFVFDARAGFLAFHRNLIGETSQLDCAYSGMPARWLSLTTEVPRLRLIDLPRSIRSGFVLYLLESYKRFLPPLWLQFGISGLVSCDPGGDAQVQLNRRMKASLAKGTMVSAADLFATKSPRFLLKLLRTQADHESFVKITQLRGQSWSMLEYLAGDEAPPDRLGRFRSFLSELTRKSSQEAVFQHHFGHGFDALVEQWREWVDQHGLCGDPTPPAEIRTAIFEKLVPAIRDRSKKAQDRIQAMRALGSAGYVLGSDALIQVLKERDVRFTPTAAWALESISGQGWGSDPDRWSAWWASRDPQSVGAVCMARDGA
jgi:hypothetical protein